MLVVTRKVGEKLLIGNDVVVHLVRVGANQARIGVDAPKTATILREELKPHVDVHGVKTLGPIADAGSIKSLLRKMRDDKEGLASIQREIQRLIAS